MRPNILSHTIRWLMERIEHFPIPVEEALWAYAYCLSGPPGHESFAFSLPSFGGDEPPIHDEGETPRQDRWQVLAPDPRPQGAAAMPSPSTIAA